MLNRSSNLVSAITFLLASATPTSARAADSSWACEVLLCASNPGGWMQYAQCVAPIRKLLRSLALGGGFPTCSAGGVAAAKYTKPKSVRPGFVVMTMRDGSRTTYTVPTQADVAQAEATANPGGPL
ncbi:hypothetical protein [Rhizorhapis suberifaciens]|uniref:Uncharacterized protein n=1 Tax=Rhizorhapis suberifaciens TaxID=13656 RepID=A0A840HYY3_9SPHN|nr:hypothetical protein [Rhizorhapis suberifaciens]MBB4642614.1 hypothetical protein [Rhizorhapis suberifaciens]